MHKRVDRVDERLRASINRLLAFSDSISRVAEDRPSRKFGAGDVLGGRLRIVRELGAGGIGIVYLAEDRYFGEVAVKMLRPELRGDTRAVERFTNEVRVARSLRHPNICPAIDLFAFDLPGGTLTAVTMEYIPGETLASRLARGAMSIPQSLGIATGIAAGIDALHREGIVHRDLKPSNILLRKAGSDLTPVIIDFGIAEPMLPAPPGRDHDTGVRGMVGSPDYMAPEQFRGSSVTEAADIYAFGLILFEMAAGKRPFPVEDLLPAAIRRATEDAPDLCSVARLTPRAWADAIARALMRDPTRRPATAMEIVRDMRSKSALSGRRSARVSGRCWHRPRLFLGKRNAESKNG